MLFSRLQQALGWQPASVDAVRDGRIRVVMMGNRWRSQHARRPPPAQQVRLPPQLGWLCLGSERHVRGAAARPTGTCLSEAEAIQALRGGGLTCWAAGGRAAATAISVHYKPNPSIADECWAASKPLPRRTMAPLHSYALVLATAHAHYVWQTTSGAETTSA